MKFLFLLALAIILSNTCLYISCAYAGTEENLIITARVPDTTPADARVFITGNEPFLGEWKADIAEMKRVNKNTYEFRYFVPETKKLEFKFTRGDFSNVEKSNDGFEVTNRTILVNPEQVNKIMCDISCWADLLPLEAQEAMNKLDIKGKYELIKDFKSKHLKYKRHVIVLLPENYDKNNSAKRYPVLYMHDGNNLFEPRLSFAGTDWGIDEAVDRLTKEGRMHEIIVVGIFNTAARMDEYTPWYDKAHKFGGKGNNYEKFMIEELKPYIDKHYKTLPDAQNTSIGGSSLGGLISLYIGLRHPEVFHGLLVVSPALWWADAKIIQWSLSQNIDPEKTKIWMDIGTDEGEEYLVQTRKLDNELRKIFKGSENYKYIEFKDMPHTEGAWRDRAHLMLLYLYGNQGEEN
ncbi:MAG: alpha/beta hydrolase-fold protein [Candidatus Wallbacteria bacterium]